MHTLVQQWARLMLLPEQQIKYLVIGALLLHACAEEICQQHNVQPNSDTAYLHQRHLLSHAYVCINFAAEHLQLNIAEILPVDCAVTFAVFCTHDHKYALAEDMLLIAVRRCCDHSLVSITARRALSLALRRQGKLEEALATQLTAMEDLNQLQIESKITQWMDAQRLRAQEELTTIYRDMGSYTMAIELQSEVVDKSKTLLGSESVDTLHEMACLARTLAKTRQYEQALLLESTILDVYMCRYPDRVEIFNKMRNVAITYYDLRRYDEAISLETAVLQGKKRLYGPAHLEVASAMQNLATTYKKQGRLHDALALYARALQIRDDTLGDCDIHTQKTARHLAETKYLLSMNTEGRPPYILSISSGKKGQD